MLILIRQRCLEMVPDPGGGIHELSDNQGISFAFMFSIYGAHAFPRLIQGFLDGGIPALGER